MNRLLAILMFVTLAGFYAVGLPHAAAQTSTGAICAATFADTNGNGLREDTEQPLAGVNINLSTGGAIIATHIMQTAEENYCFDRLLPGIYTITFTDNPLFRTTTANEGTFLLEAGQRLTINDFGAVPTGAEGLRARVAADVSASRPAAKPLDNSTRLLLATGGSMLVMLFLVGVGIVVLGMITSGPRRRKRLPVTPPPDDIFPPTLQGSR